MRYYDIRVFNVSTGKLVREWTSLANVQALPFLPSVRQADPGALNVEFDIPVTEFAEPMSQGGVGAFVRVWGIPLKDVAQGADLGVNPDNGVPRFRAEVYGGMSKGLPLAKPDQAGLLVQGQIYQAFGNWIGTDMTLDMFLLPGTGSPDAPRNIVLDWKAGMPLQTALLNTLKIAFPKHKVTVDVPGRFVRSNDEPSYHQSLTQLAVYVRDTSIDMVGTSSYSGIRILARKDEIIVTDGTSETKPKVVEFNDLIGQPTWIDAGTIQFVCPMRADIFVVDRVQMPKTLVTTTAVASPYRNKSAFQGIFLVTRIRHVGNFRQPDGLSWVTVFDAAPLPKAA